MDNLETALKEQARHLGFELVGIAPAVAADGFDRLCEWLDRGYAGAMGYMERHRAARAHPAGVLPSVRSVVMVGMSYRPRDENAPTCNAPSNAPSVKVARYARGQDYHGVLRERLKKLLDWLQLQRPGCHGRAVVDTAPLLERDFARRAGLGWFGKNTMLIDKHQGSYLFLGALLVDLVLQPDPPHDAEHCGRCRACLDACPTQAFTGAGWLDSRRCISYLTIELRGVIDPGLRAGMGDWLFGCDVCQEVCPWNGRKSLAGNEPALQARPDLMNLDPIQLLGLSEADFRQRFRGTALMRTGRTGLLRNAAIVLGNTGGAEALPALRRALAEADPTIAEAAAWAIAQIETRGAVREGESG